MKKLLLLSGLAFATIATAQTSFQVTDPNTLGPASSHYYFWVGASDPTVTLEFPVKNIGANTVKSRVAKTVTTTQAGQDIYFCYGSTCYTPFVYHSNPVNLAPGAQLPTGTGSYGVRTDFDANGVLGLSVVRYTLYDSLNTGDSVNITISYNVTANGIAPNNHVLMGNAAPNPASNIVNFTYELNGANNAAIKLYNSLGTLVKTMQLPQGSKSAQLDVSAFEEGFYFYSIISDGKAISTRRLVITR